ncbi:Lon protease family protein [Candidatus Schneideria nysicola]|nr:Lon protease family protein [Candidatus Schneideria nysicola]
MKNKKLDWQDLIPKLNKFSKIFEKTHLLSTNCCSFTSIQPRLVNALNSFYRCKSSRFMLILAQEYEEYFEYIFNVLKKINPNLFTPVKESLENNILEYKNSLIKTPCVWQDWVEYEQLFGILDKKSKLIDIKPGLIHLANGGLLILGARTLIKQLNLWNRLKQIIKQERFEWLSQDIKSSLSIFISSIPLDVQLIIIGNHENISILNDIDPDIMKLSKYGEFESEITINNTKEMLKWCNWVNFIKVYTNLPDIHHQAWPELIRQAVRYSGDKFQLPLCPKWLGCCMKEASLYLNNEKITAYSFFKSNQNKTWRENYLNQQIQKEIINGQKIIETQGKKIGQVNALSIINYSSHPLLLCEPFRISCVVYSSGEGNIHDIERKSELGGNIHTKGILIIKAFLMHILQFEDQFPFSASIVFEQSYNEIDGDSASLAELLVLISAIANQPIDQQIAITGSIDQFGNVQPIGSINEKIEGFFFLCQARGLTKNQGVIIPNANIRHLCLKEAVIQAIKNKKFSIWSVNTVYEALEIVFKIPFFHKELPNLLTYIRQRIWEIDYKRKNISWYYRILKRLVYSRLF